MSSFELKVSIRREDDKSFSLLIEGLNEQELGELRSSFFKQRAPSQVKLYLKLHDALRNCSTKEKKDIEEHMSEVCKTANELCPKCPLSQGLGISCECGIPMKGYHDEDGIKKMLLRSCATKKEAELLRDAAIVFEPKAKNELSIARKILLSYQATEVYWELHLKGSFVTLVDLEPKEIQAFIHGVIRGMKLAGKRKK